MQPQVVMGRGRGWGWASQLLLFVALLMLFGVVGVVMVSGLGFPLVLGTSLLGLGTRLHHGRLGRSCRCAPIAV